MYFVISLTASTDLFLCDLKPVVVALSSAVDHCAIQQLLQVIIVGV